MAFSWLGNEGSLSSLVEMVLVWVLILLIASPEKSLVDQRGNKASMVTFEGSIFLANLGKGLILAP